MYTVYAIIVIVGLTLVVNQIISIMVDSKQRKQMKEVERRLEKAGVTPSGATLSHGMFIDRSTDKVMPDQKQSAVFYKRLYN